MKFKDETTKMLAAGSESPTNPISRNVGLKIPETLAIQVLRGLEIPLLLVKCMFEIPNVMYVIFAHKNM